MDTARHCIDAGLFVLIWLVQMIIYPSFKYTDPEHLIEWHGKYSTLITFFVIPLMFGQVGVIAWQFSEQRSLWLILSAVAVVVAWVSTFTLSVPIHSKIAGGGADENDLWRLVVTNWPRTIAWTAVLILGLIPSLKSTT